MLRLLSFSIKLYKGGIYGALSLAVIAYTHFIVSHDYMMFSTESCVVCKLISALFF
jgi:hypothetical protein